jgi:hypothetical protein
MNRHYERFLLSAIPSFNCKKYKNKTACYFLRLANAHQIKRTFHEKALVIPIIPFKQK